MALPTLTQGKSHFSLQAWAKCIEARFFSAYRSFTKAEKTLIWLNVLSFALTMIAILCNRLLWHYRVNYQVFSAITSTQCFAVAYLGVMLRVAYPKVGTLVSTLGFFSFTTANLFFCSLASGLVTPFPLIQSHLLHVDQFFHFNQSAWILWANQYTWFITLLQTSYRLLAPNIITLVIIFLLIRQQHREVIHIMNATVIASLIGCGIYFFWPALPPASVIHSPYLPAESQNLILRYQQIHHHMSHYVSAYGLIAFPSFHIIWLFTCLIGLRKERHIAGLFCIYTVLVTLSTMLLGFHYLADVMAGMGISMLSYALALHIAKSNAR